MNTLTRLRTIAVVVVAVVLVSAGFTQDAAKKSAKPKWFAKAEQSLLGTWTNTNPDTQNIPKLDILFENDALKIRIWGRTHPKDSPFGPPDKLFVLFRRSDIKEEPRPEAIAFATHKADYALHYFTLKLRDGVIHLEGVTMFTDDSGRSDRSYVAAFSKQ